MITFLAIDCSAHWIAQQTSIKGGGFDSAINFIGGIERRFLLAICHKFDANEKTATSNVTNKWVLAKFLP